MTKYKIIMQQENISLPCETKHEVTEEIYNKIGEIILKHRND